MMKRGLSFFLVVVMLFTAFPGTLSVSAAATKTKDEAVKWTNDMLWTQAPDMDGWYAAQCVDLVQAYYGYLGVSGGGGNARDYATNALPDGFVRIPNAYGFVPEPGDIAVWSKGYGGGVYGHVGIVTAADLNTVTVADVYGSTAIQGTHYKASGETITTAGLTVHRTTYGYSSNGMVFWGVIRPSYAEAPLSAPTYVDVPASTYMLKNSDAYLNASENWDGGNVIAAAREIAAKQKFNIYKNGTAYNIESGNDGNRQLNVYTSGASVAGNNVTLWGRTNHPTQMWLFEKIGSNYVIHPSDNTGVALTVQADGNVNLAVSTGAGNQLWSLELPVPATAEPSAPVEAPAQNLPEASVPVQPSTQPSWEEGDSEMPVWDIPVEKTLRGLSSWAVKKVTVAYASGLITDELFAGNQYQNTVTRAEFCRLAIRFLEVYSSRNNIRVIPRDITPSRFSDTSDEMIGIAAALGITNGTNAEKNLFSPEGLLTREQAATMLRNVMKLIIQDPVPSRSIVWTDNAGISSWAKDASVIMYDARIMTGTSSTAMVFSPKKSYTREQAIVTMQNMMEYLD
jgi:hypothetical protein